MLLRVVVSCSAMKENRVAFALLAFVGLGGAVTQFDLCARRSGTSPVPDVSASQPRMEAAPVRAAAPLVQAPQARDRHEIAAADFGEAWPFTAQDGLLYCLGPPDRRMVVFVVGESRFAINGNARESRATFGFGDLTEIERRTADGRRPSVQPVIARGLSLCPGN